MIRRVLQPLLLTVLVAGHSAGQVTTTKSVTILRTTIETYPDAERRPILDYLDGARIVADRVIGKFANERDLELEGEFFSSGKIQRSKNRSSRLCESGEADLWFRDVVPIQMPSVRSAC